MKAFNIRIVHLLQMRKYYRRKVIFYFVHLFQMAKYRYKKYWHEYYLSHSAVSFCTMDSHRELGAVLFTPIWPAHSPLVDRAESIRKLQEMLMTTVYWKGTPINPVKGDHFIND